MPEIDPPLEIPTLSELEKLELKRDIIHFANDHDMLYKDYGSYVALQLPIYKTPRKKKGGDHAEIHTTTHSRQRARATSK